MLIFSSFIGVLIESNNFTRCIYQCIYVSMIIVRKRTVATTTTISEILNTNIYNTNISFLDTSQLH